MARERRLGEPNGDMAKVLSIAAMTALALAGSATIVHAQTAPAKKAQPQTSFAVRGDYNARDAQFAPADGRRSLVWDAKKGRWGLTLDIKPRSDIDPQVEQGRDVEAGAFFKVTPRLRVGGAVGVGPNQPTPIRKNDGREETPRVRLETAFKF